MGTYRVISQRITVTLTWLYFKVGRVAGGEDISIFIDGAIFRVGLVGGCGTMNIDLTRRGRTMVHLNCGSVGRVQ